MTTLDTMRKEGRLSLEDEEHILRLDLLMYERNDDAVRKVMLPILRQSLANYEAAKARAMSKAG